MKLGVVDLFVPMLLAACSASKSESITLLMQKPQGADESCLAVVGFELEATAGGKASSSGPILSSAAVQTLDDCRLARPFVIEGLDMEQPVTVTARGFDGAHRVRVSGTANMENLRTPSDPIELHFEGKPPPPLILDRSVLLAGTPITDVNVMKITTAKNGQPTELLNVTRAMAPEYFDVDPGGFGVEVQDTEELIIEFTLLSGRTGPKQRVIATFDGTGPVFRAR